MEYCVITSASEQLSNHIGDFTSKWDQKTRSRAECWTRRGGVTCQRHRWYCVASKKKKSHWACVHISFSLQSYTFISGE